MKDIKLMSLTLKNFKGIKEFKLDAGGVDVKIFGTNGAGKTSIKDAFTYLLFDKDSEDKKDFGIKTLDSNGNEIHYLEHEVEGILLIDGKPLRLKKVYAEDWRKEKGTAVESFKGHSTSYFVDGVPGVKMKDYKELIDSIMDEALFKQITSQTYFNEKMKWEDQRATLLQIAGDVSEEDVIAGNEKLKELPVILQGQSIENHRKIVAARNAEINKALKEIPVRISELKNSMPEHNIDVEVLKVELAKVLEEISSNETLINNIRNGAVIIDRKQKLQQVEMDLQVIQRDFESDSLSKVNGVKTKIQEEESNVRIFESQKESLERQKSDKLARIEELKAERSILLVEHKQEKEKLFNHVAECECPTCGQSLPEEQVEAVKKKAEEQFNLAKSNKLEAIMTKGSGYKPRIQALLEEIANVEAEVIKVKGQIDAKNVAIPKLKEVVTELQANIIDVTKSVDFEKKAQEADKLRTEIGKLQQNTEGAANDLIALTATIRTRSEELNVRIAQGMHHASTVGRVAELEAQQTQLAQEFESNERGMLLTEEFIRTKVEMLTGRINGMFKMAKFKLFDVLVNGSIKETCVTLVNGVPYDKGLNYGAKVNVGIDICSTLQAHYGIKSPIFVDNSESVVELLETDTQMISLIVSGEDKKLRVEKGSNEGLVIDVVVS